MHWTLRGQYNLAEKGVCMVYPSPLYPASVVFFQLHGCMISLMQVFATPSSTAHNSKYSFSWILTTESILVLAACS